MELRPVENDSSGMCVLLAADLAAFHLEAILVGRSSGRHFETC